MMSLCWRTKHIQHAHRLWDEGTRRANMLMNFRVLGRYDTSVSVSPIYNFWQWKYRNNRLLLGGNMVSHSALRGSSLTFRFSLSLAASFGWLNRNMLVLPSRITAPGRQHNRQEVKTLHTTLKTTIIKDIFTVTQLKRSDWWGFWRLTLVELRRLRHLDSVHWTLSAAERNQSHFAVLVLKHAVFALQVQTVQDCRRGRPHGTHMETVSHHRKQTSAQTFTHFLYETVELRVITEIKTAHEHETDNWGMCDATINRSDQKEKSSFLKLILLVCFLLWWNKIFDHLGL